MFAPIFDPIIEDYHKGFKSTDKHPAKNWGDVNTLGDLDPEVIFIRRQIESKNSKRSRFIDSAST